MFLEKTMGEGVGEPERIRWGEWKMQMRCGARGKEPSQNVIEIIKFYKTMEKSISREEVLQTISKMEIVEHLTKGVLEEFCKVLKIGEGSSDPRVLSAHLQHKIVDIFDQEGEAYEDYLQLPKFRVLGPQLSQQLVTLFRRVWRQYHRQSRCDHLSQLNREIQELFPKVPKAEQQSFHLASFQLFRDSGLFPRKIATRDRKEDENRKTQSDPAPQGLNGNIPQNIFPYFPFPPTYAKVEHQEGVNYFLENNKAPEAHSQSSQGGQPLFEVPRFPMQSPFMLPEYFGNHQKLPIQKTETNHILPSIFGNEKQNLIKFMNYKFIQCVCLGTLDQDQEGGSFKCSLCKYEYHYSCLKMEGKVEDPVTCPLCILRRETLFCTVMKQPLKYDWHCQERTSNKEFTLRITEEDSKEVYQARDNGLDCQIRFLKIDGKTFKKENRIFDQLQYGQPKYSEITLPELTRNQIEPISLQIVLRSDEDTDTSPKLYFFSVFLIRTKKKEDVLEELFQNGPHVDESYYSQFMRETDKVVIPLTDNGGSYLMHYPVRGADCQHLEVFDFKMYLDRISQLNQDKEKTYCDCCGKQVTAFKYDSLIYRCINSYPDYDQRQPQGIQITKEGEIEWVQLEQPSQSSEDKVNGNHVESEGYPQEEEQEDSDEES